MLRILFFAFLLSTTSSKSYTQIINIESQRIITDTIGWSGNFGIAVNASKNTKSYFAFNGNSHLQYKSKKDLVLGILNYTLINGGGEDFGKNGFAHLRYNRKLNTLVRLEAFSQIQFNEISKIQFRSLNGLGIRLKLSEYERAKFYYGLTYMYEYEEINDNPNINRDSRLSSYLTFTLIPEKTIVLRNTTYIQPLFNAFVDYRLANDTGLIFNITSHLKFTTNFNFLYDSRPPEGVPKSSFIVRNGLDYRF